MPQRVALVTGGSRGIGFAIARRLHTDGMAVCITGRSQEGLADAVRSMDFSDRLLAIPGHNDDPDHRRAAVDAVAERWGGLDILVNNVGINPVFGGLLDIDDHAAQKTLNVNLLASLGWVREMQRVNQGRPGNIVNISSFAAVRPSPGLGMYGASKAALCSATKQLALELAPDIRVNSVVPALIATEFAGKLYEGRRDIIEATYPMRRLGRPEDIAAAVAFLASEDAAWITGQSLVVDGGLSLTGGVE